MFVTRLGNQHVMFTAQMSPLIIFQDMRCWVSFCLTFEGIISEIRK